MTAQGAYGSPSPTRTQVDTSSKSSRGKDAAIGDRAKLMCATVGCPFLVHARVELGGYCCLACAEGGDHGKRCQKINAPRGLLRADPTWWPMDGTTLADWDVWHNETARKDTPINVLAQDRPKGKEEAEAQQAIRQSLLDAARSGDNDEFDMPDSDSDAVEDWGDTSDEDEDRSDREVIGSEGAEHGIKMNAAEVSASGLQAGKDADFGEIVVSWKNVRLTRGDVALFQEGHWLNDACIDFFFEHLTREYHDMSDRLLLLGATTAFWLVNEKEQDDLEKAANSLQLSKKSLIMCPVNDHVDASRAGGTHWSLLVARRAFSGKELLVFEHIDSMSLNSQFASHYAKRLDRLDRLATQSSDDVDKDIEAPQVTEVCAAMQTTSCDCGVYVLAFAEAVLEAFKGSEEPQVANIKHEDILRRRMQAVTLVEAAAKLGVSVR